MNDRELLELAAKAAGYDYRTTEDHDRLMVRGDDLLRRPWNPLTDDGDALRLAVKLSMSVDIDLYENATYAYAGGDQRVFARENWSGDRESATRRAIVRAAAEIGKLM